MIRIGELARGAILAGAFDGMTVDRHGNTSAASIPIALCEAQASGQLSDGNNIVFVAFGGGLAWAAGVAGGIARFATPDQLASAADDPCRRSSSVSRAGTSRRTAPG